MKKQKDHAFNKDVYLLGTDEDGVKYWLEAPSWDCGWYWGFGYIETYQNNAQPSEARDISSHTHATKFMSEYFTEFNGSKPILKSTTFTEKEGWELSELFKRFYILQDCAALFRSGDTHVTSSKVVTKKEDWSKEINEVLIPQVTARILEILSPVQ